MPVIGLKFNSIDAKRDKDKIEGELKINSSPKIVSVKEVELGPLKQKGLSMGFEFVTQYNPNIAMIRMNGDIFYVNEERAKILKEWKKEKKLPDAVGMEVINHLFRSCLLKISGLAEDLQLPPPLNFPVVRPKSDQANYIG
jgi:hypothetical protein